MNISYNNDNYDFKANIFLGGKNDFFFVLSFFVFLSFFASQFFHTHPVQL